MVQMKDLARSLLYMENIDIDIEEMVKSCQAVSSQTEPICQWDKSSIAATRMVIGKECI